MSDEIVKRVLQKFKKADFLPLCQIWGKIKLEEIVQDFDRSTKAGIIAAIQDFINHSDTLKTDDIFHLDLIYMNQNPTKKLWILYNFTPLPGKRKAAIQDPAKLSKYLKKEINLYYRSTVTVRVAQQGVTWVRCWLHEGNEASNNVVYIVFIPNTNYFFMSSVWKTQLVNLVGALMAVLGGHRPLEGQLSDRNLFSMLQLLHNKHSEVSKGKGSFGQLRCDQHLSGPLSQKRKHSADEAHVLKEPEGVVVETSAERSKRQKAMADVFGPEDKELPTLEKVSYTLKTPFKPKLVPLDTLSQEEAFDCHVTFSGRSVLEGIRRLGELGLAQLPMPAHLTEVHLRGQNRFTIRPRRTGSDGASNRTSTPLRE